MRLFAAVLLVTLALPPSPAYALRGAGLEENAAKKSMLKALADSPAVSTAPAAGAEEFHQGGIAKISSSGSFRFYERWSQSFFDIATDIHRTFSERIRVRKSFGDDQAAFNAAVTEEYSDPEYYAPFRILGYIPPGVPAYSGDAGGDINVQAVRWWTPSGLLPSESPLETLPLRALEGSLQMMLTQVLTDTEGQIVESLEVGEQVYTDAHGRRGSILLFMPKTITRDELRKKYRGPQEGTITPHTELALRNGDVVWSEGEAGNTSRSMVLETASILRAGEPLVIMKEYDWQEGAFLRLWPRERLDGETYYTGDNKRAIITPTTPIAAGNPISLSRTLVAFATVMEVVNTNQAGDYYLLAAADATTRSHDVAYTLRHRRDLNGYRYRLNITGVEVLAEKMLASPGSGPTPAAGAEEFQTFEALRDWTWTRGQVSGEIGGIVQYRATKAGRQPIRILMVDVRENSPERAKRRFIRAFREARGTQKQFLWQAHVGSFNDILTPNSEQVLLPNLPDGYATLRDDPQWSNADVTFTQFVASFLAVEEGLALLGRRLPPRDKVQATLQTMAQQSGMQTSEILLILLKYPREPVTALSARLATINRAALDATNRIVAERVRAMLDQHDYPMWILMDRTTMLALAPRALSDMRSVLKRTAEDFATVEMGSALETVQAALASGLEETVTRPGPAGSPPSASPPPAAGLEENAPKAFGALAGTWQELPDAPRGFMRYQVTLAGRSPVYVQAPRSREFDRDLVPGRAGWLQRVMQDPATAQEKHYVTTDDRPPSGQLPGVSITQLPDFGLGYMRLLEEPGSIARNDILATYTIQLLVGFAHALAAETGRTQLRPTEQRVVREAAVKLLKEELKAADAAAATTITARFLRDVAGNQASRMAAVEVAAGNAYNTWFSEQILTLLAAHSGPIWIDAHADAVLALASEGSEPAKAVRALRVASQGDPNRTLRVALALLSTGMEESSAPAAGLEEPVREFGSVDEVIETLRRENARFNPDDPAITMARSANARAMDFPSAEVPESLWKAPAPSDGIIFVYTTAEWQETIRAGVRPWRPVRAPNGVRLNFYPYGVLIYPQWISPEDPPPAGSMVGIRPRDASPMAGMPNLVLANPGEVTRLNPGLLYSIATNVAWNDQTFPIVSVLAYTDAQGRDRFAVFV
ncbi:MAG: hypothetical protein HY600_03560 [Candidatus Omnitrophica bacterium]|nr:hypothetical protein [Candidatus Omnitrophota bacterium]